MTSPMCSCLPDRLGTAFRWIPLICVAWLAVACQSPSWTNPVDELVVTEEQNGQTLSLSAGQTLSVRLKSQPGTGHRWSLAKMDDVHLRMVNESQSSPDSKEPLPGGEEYQIFRVKAIHSGPAFLELHYARPWEKTAPAKIFRLNLRIK